MKQWTAVLSLCALTTGALFAARVKNDDIETKIIRLPKIACENANYTGMSVAYAVGEIVITKSGKSTEEIACYNQSAGKVVMAKIEYISVEYARPALLIIVRDNNGKVIYAEKSESGQSATAQFGKGECKYYLPGAVDKDFEEQKSSFLKSIQNEEIKSLKENTADIISTTLFAGYAEEEFRLHYVDNKDGKYGDLEEARTLAKGVYDICSQANGYSQKQVEPLNKAVALWEKALTESNLSEKSARINYDITIKLHENVAIAQLFLGDYEAAIMRFNKIKSLEKYASTSSSKSHFSQIKARALDRVTGINRNRTLLASDEKLKKALQASSQYRASIRIANPQDQYGQLEKEYENYKSAERGSNTEFVKEAETNAVAAGSVNPYEKEIMYAALQGYAFMKTPLMALGTKYTEVPIEVCAIERLNQILITNNNVTKIPPEIGNLKNLKVLDLKNNKITSVPAEINGCTALEKLNLSGNQIATLPVTIMQMKSLKTLDIKDNPLSADEVARIKKALPECKVKF